MAHHKQPILSQADIQDLEMPGLRVRLREAIRQGPAGADHVLEICRLLVDRNVWFNIPFSPPPLTHGIRRRVAIARPCKACGVNIVQMEERIYARGRGAWHEDCWTEKIDKPIFDAKSAGDRYAMHLAEEAQPAPESEAPPASPAPSDAKTPDAAISKRRWKVGGKRRFVDALSLTHQFNITHEPAKEELLRIWNEAQPTLATNQVTWSSFSSHMYGIRHEKRDSLGLTVLTQHNGRGKGPPGRGRREGIARALRAQRAQAPLVAEVGKCGDRLRKKES